VATFRFTVMYTFTVHFTDDVKGHLNHASVSSHIVSFVYINNSSGVTVILFFGVVTWLQLDMVYNY